MDELPQLITSIIITETFVLKNRAKLKINRYFSKEKPKGHFHCPEKLFADLMKTSMDIAMLSASFTAGIAAGMSISTFAVTRISPAGLYPGASISLSLVMLSVLVCSVRKNVRAADVIFLYMSAGIFCWFSGEIAGIGATENSHTILYRSAAHVKSVIDGIPFSNPDTPGLVKALITGDRSDIGKQVIKAFRESGASHILALSGLHLGIIYAILLKLLSVFGNSPAAIRTRSIVIMAFSGFYTLATGACESLVRAYLFILLNESARMLHRNTDPVGVFFCALMIQLAVKPSSITSVGFQLSYMAIAGICFLLPILKSWYPADNDDKCSLGHHAVSVMPRKIWNAAAMTTACQIFTGPVAWHHFHTFPTYFLVTNLLALPVTNILMIIAVGTATLSAMGLCPEFMIWATDGLASLLIFIMNVSASM